MIKAIPCSETDRLSGHFFRILMNAIDCFDGFIPHLEISARLIDAFLMMKVASSFQAAANHSSDLFRPLAILYKLFDINYILCVRLLVNISIFQRVGYTLRLHPVSNIWQFVFQHFNFSRTYVWAA